MVLAFPYGLSMDSEAFILARMREKRARARGSAGPPGDWIARSHHLGSPHGDSHPPARRMALGADTGHAIAGRFHRMNTNAKWACLLRPSSDAWGCGAGHAVDLAIPGGTGQPVFICSNDDMIITGGTP